MSLTLTWSQNCVLTSRAYREANADADPAVAGINNPTNATFKVKDTKLYVPVVTLSAQDDNKLLEQLKTGFKRTIRRSKYRSEMSNQNKTDNLDYLVDSTFTKVNILFVLSFENEEGRTSYFTYYTPTIEITDYNVLIEGKSFFDVPVKNKEEAYEKIIEMSGKNDYITGNLLDYEYFSKHYKLISIDLSRTIELENPDLKQKINFIGKLKEDNAATLFIIEELEETTFNFSQNSVDIISNEDTKDYKFVIRLNQ